MRATGKNTLQALVT